MAAAPQAGWRFVRLYAGRTNNELDRLVADAIPTVVTCGLHERWFFLRYADDGGPHVRLRLRARPGCAKELADALQAMADAARARAAFDVYVPELEKFGGPPGIAIAEELFELSSELAVQLVRNERTGGEPRRAFCTGLMALAVAAFPPPGAEARFWRQYAERLGGGTVVATAAPPAAGSSAILERWREGLERCAARYRELATRPPSEALAAHFLHLMNNRLGISVVEEARLAGSLAERAAATASA